MFHHFNYYSLVILGGFAAIGLGLGIATIKHRKWVRNSHLRTGPEKALGSAHPPRLAWPG